MLFTYIYLFIFLQVADDFPITSKTLPLLPRNPDNPYDVLQRKGLLNISRNSAQIDDCPHDMKLNFYAEESDRDGNTLKVFQSDHHFKNGTLIYSATQEVFPDLTSILEKSAERKMVERRAVSAGTGITDFNNKRYDN